MANYFDSVDAGALGKRDLLGVDIDNTYPGLDLTVKFADEIAAAPYNGDEWAWITARKNADNFSGIHVKDYIPVVANGNTYKARIMGINTYKGYGDTEVGKHIDWIFEELWPTLKPINPANYNNGLIPVENVAADGTTTEFTLTKEMNSINNIMMGGEVLTGWTYDATTFKITFEEAPAAGTLVVTGNGTEFPWLASDAYHFANSLAGQVPNGTGFNPAVKHVDYTQGGIYYYLPQKLKNVIIQKRMYLPKRYSATDVLSNSNAGGWVDIGYIWFPTECEVYGQGVRANAPYDMMGSAIQYPYFAGSMNRVKKRSGSRYGWWLLSASLGYSLYWCLVDLDGLADIHGVSHAYVAAPVCFRT